MVVSAVERTSTNEAAAALAAFADELQAGWAGDVRVSAIAATHLLGHALANAGRGDDRGAASAQRLLDRAEAVLA